MKKVSLLLSFIAMFFLFGCQTDQQVTSVHPALQSSEARALRQQLSGSTLTWKMRDNDLVKGCSISLMLLPDGKTVRDIRCKQLVSESVLYTKSDGNGAFQRAEGSWAVRENKLCLNYFRINGQPASEELRQSGCMDVRLNGQKGSLTQGSAVINFTINPKAS